MTQLSVLELRVACTIEEIAMRASTDEWSELNMACVRVTRVFVDLHVATVFCSEISNRPDMESSIRSVLNILADVFILDALRSGIPDLAEYEMVPPKSLRTLRTAFTLAINALETDLIGLTDAFGFTDWELNSVLGRADGNVYQEIWKTVNKRNPINTSRLDGPVVSSFETLLRPLHTAAKL